MRVVLIGGGDLARQIAHYIQSYDARAVVVGFVDDFATKGEERFGLRCMGSIKDILTLYTCQQLDAVFLSIGYIHREARQHLFEMFHHVVPFYTFIHPKAFVDPSASIGKGCCVGPHTIIEQHVVLGPNVFLYGGVNISHDSEIGAHSFIAPSVSIAGFVKVGLRCFLGIHSTIIERVHVTDDVLIGAATLVTNNLPEPGLYIGVPAHKK